MSLNPSSSSSSKTNKSPSPSPSKRESKSPSPSRFKEQLKNMIPAKMLAMKKSAKSGNKQKQKETNAQIQKLEEEQDERHRQELLEAERKQQQQPDGSSSSATAPPAESSEAPPTSTDPPVPEKEGDEEESTTVNKFYKNLTISSKNAKKQAKKKEMEDKMKLAAAQDKEAAKKQDSEKHIEKAAIKAMLVEDHLKMIDIPADGDCMYNALVHQLQEEGIEISVRKLRKHCAAYMREHPDDFRPFVADIDVAEAGPGDKTTDWEMYLQGVERCAEVGGVWGGELELKAVSQIYEKTIKVYRQNGGPYQIGDEFSSPKDRALRIVYLRHAYHLGEHYNSTCFY